MCRATEFGSETRKNIQCTKSETLYSGTLRTLELLNHELQTKN